jgi:hypothetical protein
MAMRSPEVQLEGEIMTVFVLGINVGRNICSLVDLDISDAVLLRRGANKKMLIGLAAKLVPCVVDMAACCGAHYLGRIFAARGHPVDRARICVALCQGAERHHRDA